MRDILASVSCYSEMMKEVKKEREKKRNKKIGASQRLWGFYFQVTKERLNT
jgi:hypothetical protein